MTHRVICVSLTEGVHTRPAAVFVKTAAKYKSEISLTSDGTTVNGKSIMGILMLSLVPGTEVTISANGEDEESAVEELGKILTGTSS